MPRENVAQPERPPHLAKAWIDIEKNPALWRREDFRIREEAHHIEQHYGLTRHLHDARTRNAESLVVTGK